MTVMICIIADTLKPTYFAGSSASRLSTCRPSPAALRRTFSRWGSRVAALVLRLCVVPSYKRRACYRLARVRRHRVQRRRLR